MKGMDRSLHQLSSCGWRQDSDRAGGRVELQFQNGTYLRIGEESQVDIIALSSGQGTFLSSQSVGGRIYVNHHPILGRLPPYMLTFFMGFFISCSIKIQIDFVSSQVRISVLEGGIEFKRDGRPIPVAQGKMLIVGVSVMQRSFNLMEG